MILHIRLKNSKPRIKIFEAFRYTAMPGCNKNTHTTLTLKYVEQQNLTTKSIRDDNSIAPFLVFFFVILGNDIHTCLFRSMLFAVCFYGNAHKSNNYNLDNWILYDVFIPWPSKQLWKENFFAHTIVPCLF